MSFYQADPRSIFSSSKYHLRQDLSCSDRLSIGLAVLSKSYGTITHLSQRYAISRTFVYQLGDQLSQVLLSFFSPASSIGSPEALHEASLRFILSHRLIGKSSIESISELMKRASLPYHSVGYISQVLNLIGSSLSQDYQREQGVKVGVVFASDEVFAHRQPILITVDPISSAILRIELADSREAKIWKNHWTSLLDNGFEAIYVVADQGTGLAAARKSLFPDQPYQPDTYHAVAHRLGIWAERLKKAAYKAIDYEYDREAKIQSAKREATIEKRMKQYYLAQAQSQQKIQLYDTFCFLYSYLIENLQVFDSKGQLNDGKKAQKNIQDAIQWLKTLPNEAMGKEVLKIEQLLPDLLHFLKRAKPIVQQLSTQYRKDYLETFCAAWQAQKNAIKAKNTKRKHFFLNLMHQHINRLKPFNTEEFQERNTHIFEQLDRIVQSSAMVENINSILRPYLNTSKNLISQPMLNLILFYHNHRLYRAGKRKGKSPSQLLEGKQEQEDWIELLVKHIKKMCPQLKLTQA